MTMKGNMGHEKPGVEVLFFYYIMRSATFKYLQLVSN